MNYLLASNSASQAVPRIMKAAQISAFGGYDQITLADLPTPAPGRTQVLVRVLAAGVGPWDGWILAGRSALAQPLPLTLGADFAGEVVALGEDVSGLSVGDSVYGVINVGFTGAWAEYAVAEAGMIARAPNRLTAVEAASAPIAAATAQQALFQEAGLKAGRRVLILGAAGAVGAYAVQMARYAALQAIATVSERDVDYVRSLGAQQVLGRDANLTGLSVDAVIDLVGGEPQRRAFSALKAGGKLISAVSAPDADLAAAAGVESRFSSSRRRRRPCRR